MNTYKQNGGILYLLGENAAILNEQNEAISSDSLNFEWGKQKLIFPFPLSLRLKKHKRKFEIKIIKGHLSVFKTYQKGWSRVLHYKIWVKNL